MRAILLAKATEARRADLRSSSFFNHSAVPGDRRTVHRALAEATDPSTDPDRRAWHGAYAAIGPDEDVALELERSAVRAQGRAGLAAAAAFHERAAALTLDPGLRRIRGLTAAQAMLQAGAPEPAREMLRTQHLQARYRRQPGRRAT